MDSTFLGTLGWTPGEVLNCTGEVTPLHVDRTPGNNLKSRPPGMLVKTVCCWGRLRSAGGYPTSLRLITALLEESILLAGSLSGELRYMVVFFS